MQSPLIVPTLEQLPRYVAALERGWTPDFMRGHAAAQEQLDRIDKDARGFIEMCTNLGARGDPVTLPDGSVGQRIPSRTLWIWDEATDDFCGILGIRWQTGTPALPPHVLGHVGYSVVPWRHRQGWAGAALKAVLPYARGVGLPYVEVTCDPDNVASIKVIEHAGGVLFERFTKPVAFGGTPGLRWRIPV